MGHRFVLACALLLFAGAAPDSTLTRVRAWRTQHETAILKELFDLLSLPNVATNQSDMRRNADALKQMLERRRFTAEILPTTGSPVVLAERRAPNAALTLTFYFHYDGQPVDPREWTHGPPFTPVIVGDRIYGRSSSDDKSPIVAFLSAIDALDASTSPLTSAIRVILEGDEEAGSPSLEAIVRAHGDRMRGDALIMVDGPRHASGRTTMNFGARGVMAVDITVYGANHDLHSGNYGNWAPNPALALARLLASMKDERGRVTIAGFYDDVVPLTAAERLAIEEIPDVEVSLMKEFGFSRQEDASQRLEMWHNQPALNVNGFESGTVGGQGRTIIPAVARARLDVRLVAAIDPARQFERIAAHVRQQGFFLADAEPGAAMRAAQPRIARVTRVGGYPAGRTPIDLPIAASIVNVLTEAAGGPIVRLPTVGGSLPFYVFSDVLKVPTVGLSVVNFDNNQHGPNENLRIQSLWDAIESMAALLTMK
jgi:acetylornithine deacetylase/succinyl-diaminopimelate desuccinylase-like protein